MYIHVHVCIQNCLLTVMDVVEFTLQHALDYRKGGLIIKRHNEVREALGDLASIAFRDVIRTNCERC